MNIDGHTLPCYFADVFRKPTTKTPCTIGWFSDDFCLIFTLHDFVEGTTRIEDRYWIETDSFVHSSVPKNLTPLMVMKEILSHMYMLHIHKSPTTLVFHTLKSFYTLKNFVENQNLLKQHNIQTFLFHTLMVLFCMHTGYPNTHSVISEYISQEK